MPEYLDPIRKALTSDDPEAELLRLAQGCTEFTCLYHGQVNVTLRKWRQKDLTDSLGQVTCEGDHDSPSCHSCGAAV